MTSVNITTETNTVVVTESGTTTVVTVPETSVVTALTAGPQGPQGPQGPVGPGGIVVNDTAKVNKSIVYYDAPSSSFKADATWTTDTIVDGANF